MDYTQPPRPAGPTYSRSMGVAWVGAGLTIAWMAVTLCVAAFILVVYAVASRSIPDGLGGVLFTPTVWAFATAGFSLAGIVAGSVLCAQLAKRRGVGTFVILLLLCAFTIASTALAWWVVARQVAYGSDLGLTLLTVAGLWMIPLAFLLGGGIWGFTDPDIKMIRAQEQAVEAAAVTRAGVQESPFPTAPVDSQPRSGSRQS